MIERFSSNFMNPPKVIWLKDLKMVSGCIGCLKCSMNLHCVFTERDGHRALLDEDVVGSDILVMASDITNCYLTPAWQQFFTRLFSNGHVPYFSHMQVGFLFSGPYTNYPYIREIFEGFIGYARNGIYDYLSDECADQKELEEHLDRMAQVLLADSERRYFPAPKFQAISAQKLFRDEIFDQLRVVFQNDHRYFKKHGMYDFPTKKLGKRLVMTMLSWLLRIPGIRQRFYTKEMIPGMLRPYEKVLRPMRRAREA